MKKFLLSLITMLFLITSGHAQDACHPRKEGKLRIFGDSWAQFPFIYAAYDTALVQFGLPDFYSKGQNTAIISMDTEAFLNPLAKLLWQPAIDDDARHNLDAMVLTLFGNDVAFKFHRGDDPRVLDAPFAEAKMRMDTLIDYIKAKLPNVQILWTCYDYPNFLDPIIEFPWNPYKDLWDGRGQPEPWEMNQALIRMTFLQDSLVKVWNRPYVHFVNNLGLMQFKYGQLTPLRTWPGGTYPPRSVPFPGGDPNYPSPWPAMGLLGLDTYHLGPQGFTYLAAYQLRAFFMNHFRRDRDTTVYSMGKTFDGWVSSTGATGTGDVLVGKNASDIKMKGIFSFNTEFIPDDKKIKRAALFIRRKDGNYRSYTKDDFPTNFKLDIKSGTFGSDQIEASDFNAPATATDIACFAGKPKSVDYSLRMDLTEGALANINKAGITQFRLEIATDTAVGQSVINFFNGDTTEFEGPYLDIYYDTTSLVSGIINKQTVKENLQVFPNPAQQDITLQLTKEWMYKKSMLTIYNAQGASVYSAQYDKMTNTALRIDVSGLASGNYIIHLENDENSSSGSFVKIK